MRAVDVSRIEGAVENLCLKANFELREDVFGAIESALKKETDARAKSILKTLVENALLAKENRVAICQDTGMVFVHLDVGQNVRFTGGSLQKAINDGVERAYSVGCLRKSVVRDHVDRKNTGTNTPAVIVTDIVPGDRVRIDVSPKGFGSENKSRIRMFRPTASIREVKDFVIETVKLAGADACPPFVLGIGIGGTFDFAASLAKRALLRPINKSSRYMKIAKLEKEILREINSLGMGPMALGGKTTALGVNIIGYPTHIAGYPVAINMSCHATRSASATI